MGGVGDEGNNGAVVIGIDVSIQHTSCFDGRNSFTQSCDCFPVAAFAEVWYTLNEIADCRLPIADWFNGRQDAFRK